MAAQSSKVLVEKPGERTSTYDQASRATVHASHLIWSCNLPNLTIFYRIWPTEFIPKTVKPELG